MSLSSIEEKDKCLICNNTFGKKDKIYYFGVNGRPKFKEQTKKWSKLKIHKDNNEHIYTLLHRKLHGTKQPFERSHRSCKREFWFKIHKQYDKIWREKSYQKSNQFFFQVISERMFQELLSVNIRIQILNSICFQKENLPTPKLIDSQLSCLNKIHINRKKIKIFSIV